MEVARGEKSLDQTTPKVRRMTLSSMKPMEAQKEAVPLQKAPRDARAPSLSSPAAKPVVTRKASEGDKPKANEAEVVATQEPSSNDEPNSEDKSAGEERKSSEGGESPGGPLPEPAVQSTSEA